MPARRAADAESFAPGKLGPELLAAAARRR
jgi:hypothetical protein